MLIKNKQALIENGEKSSLRRARSLALDSIQIAINAVDPKKLVAAQLTLKENHLQVHGHSFDLAQFYHIYVVGGGKASGQMAEAIEAVLGDGLTEGVVNVPYGDPSRTEKIRLQPASHPLPDQAGVEGAKQMLKLAEKATENDLVICLISGGGSSLLCCPRNGISLKDKQELTSALLRSGATINEINSVRKHLSGFKGGWLAKKAYPATIISIILSDVVGDPLDVIASGPTVADVTTFADAKSVLEKYELWTNLSDSVRKVIMNGIKGHIAETPKPADPAFERVFNVVLGNNRTACLAAKEHLEREGVDTVLLTSTIEGEAKCVGNILSAIAREVLASGNPKPKPVAIIAGGETTVKVTGSGKGGRNQELALSAAQKLDIEGAVVVCVGTDGVDGPTDAAGAIADSSTLKRAATAGLNPREFLAANDSYHFFAALGDLVFTGQTGTNVNDIAIIIVL
ncbi:MAG: glycerate kinase [Candidatus Bathyarchaeota archaeon]|nr:glycerate kinase [Candidatus Bathyarchaeota archaeon]